MAKPPKYRLQVLLVIKERAKRASEVALAKAIRKLKEAEEELVKLEKERDDILDRITLEKERMNEAVSSGNAVMQDPQFRLNFIRKLKEDLEDIDKKIEEQKAEIIRAQKRVQRARQDYILAAQEMNMMEKHKELFMKKHQKELSALEDKEMTELGMVIHQLNKMQS